MGIGLYFSTSDIQTISSFGFHKYGFPVTITFLEAELQKTRPSNRCVPFCTKEQNLHHYGNV